MDWFSIIEKIVETKNPTKFKMIMYVDSNSCIEYIYEYKRKGYMDKIFLFLFFQFFEKLYHCQEKSAYIHRIPSLEYIDFQFD